MNVMSSNSEKVDKMLTELKIDRMQHASFAHATSEKRLVATHHNEMKNVKSRYETMFNVRKRQLIKSKDEMKSVE